MNTAAPADRRAPLLVLVAGLASLAIAFTSQYWGGLVPCPLCIYQRYPYGVAAVLGLIGLAVAPRSGWLRIVLVVAAVVFFVDAGIAAFHVGVEQHWWQGLAECTSSLPTGVSAEELKQQLLATPVTPCDKVQWSLFGISMAGYNFIYAAGCGLLTLWAAARQK